MSFFDFGLEMASWNMDDGMPDAILRSLRKGFLTGQEYQLLSQTSNITEFKIVMEDTDYGNSIFEGQPEDRFDVPSLMMAMKEKLMDQMQYLLTQTSYPLNHFIQMMLHRYQIDNVVFIIEGLKERPPRPMEELMRLSDPRGRFPELKNVQPVDGDDYASLY